MSDIPETKTGWLFFALGSAFFAAITAILSKVGVGEINSNLASLIRTAIILVMTAGIVAFRSEWEPLQKLSMRGLVVLIFSGLATGLSWLCYFRALQMAPASRVAPIDKLSVALVIVFGVICLGEPLTWKVAIGGGLIVAGAVVLAT
jgi:transporter family protein